MAVLKKRISAILGRWLEVVALGIVSPAILALLHPLLPTCQKINPALGWALTPSLILVLALCWSFAKGRMVGWTGLRHLFTYPPPWLAAILGLILLFAYLFAFPATMQKLECDPLELEPIITTVQGRKQSLLRFPAFLLLALVAVWRTAKILGANSDRRTTALSIGLDKAPSPKEKITTSTLSSNFEELKKWFKDDQPINHPNLDAFNTSIIAQRIATSLTSPTESHQTIAIVGEPGAGKSSVLNLVLYELIKNKTLGNTVTIIPISLWPFDTVEAAVRGILAPLSTSIARHINTSPIAGLPDEYISAIENTGHNWARILRSSKSPSAVLASYDRIASAIGLRIVLWVEDIERFAGTAVTPRAPEVERLEPIRSLLNLLSDFKSLRIILASAALSTRFDIEKFARLVEPLPQPDSLSLWKVLNCFRENHLTNAKDIIDPVSHNVRKKLNGPTDATEIALWGLFNRMSPARALATLCNNPRRLKYCLRHCDDAWTRLKGEIDFDDVLLISAIRAAEPDVFSLINRFIDELREGRYSRRGTPEGPTAFALELEPLLSKSPGPRRAAVEEALDFVFPGWKTGNKDRSGHQKPQGIATKSPRDYWIRYLTSTIIPENEKDQRVLRTILSWESKTSNELAQMLVAGDQNSAIEAFSLTYLNRESLMRLLQETTRLEHSRPPEILNGKDPESLLSIWNIMLRKHPDQEHLISTLKQLLAETVPTRLHLAFFFVHFFSTHSGENVPDLLSDDGYNEIRKEFERLLLQSFTPKNSNQLITALKHGPPYLLYQSSWGIVRIRRASTIGEPLTEEPFTGWPALSDAVLDAVEANPDLMLAQLVPFITTQGFRIRFDGERHRQETVFSFSEAAARNLFNYEKLASLLRKHESPKLPEPGIQQAYQVARQAVLQLPSSGRSPQIEESANKTQQRPPDPIQKTHPSARKRKAKKGKK